MSNFSRILAMFCLILPYGWGIADELDERWYFAPSIFYIAPDDDRQAKNGFGSSITLGKPLIGRIDLEVGFFADNIKQKGDAGQFNQRGLMLDGLYYFTRNSGFAPYFVVGGGIARTKLNSNASTSTLGQAGFGFTTKMTKSAIKLRSDIRYRMDEDDKSIPNVAQFGDWVVSIGLSVPIGDPPPPPVYDEDGDGVWDDLDRCSLTLKGAVVDMWGCELDSDSDGVTDSSDLCPGTLKATVVGSDGCLADHDHDGITDSQDQCPNTPDDSEVDENGCEPDGDGDKVPNSVDQCPNTPVGIKVSPDGCELDQDGDGVNDSHDQCPNTEKGSNIDKNGCEIPKPEKTKPVPLKVTVLDGVYFSSGSDNLNAASKASLRRVANQLMQHPDMLVKIVGYTDNSGARDLNIHLSRIRAYAVMNYLVEQGVNADNISADGEGSANPVADNSTPEGRALNRRVELHMFER